ncbi:alpha/beta hydrolase family protein [Streptomyces megasporus]|uniref:alpha/beta hydrolase family protein n=1 Tax=Streptomyces megasporus TaxID=44060 RepID=UPI0004E1487C|nr:prolyl oligopeptidase family serine peptidase [Streptomyces megasporus]
MVTVPAHPSVTERHPSPVHWRSLVLDPALAGAVPGRARPRRVEFFTARRPDDGWELPLADVLSVPLAWHPRQPLAAGLAVRGHRAHPWIADLAARTVRLYEDVTAATGLTEPGRPPIVWLDDGRLALLVPAPRHEPAAEPPAWRAAAFEATGPGFVSFEPGLEELRRAAGTRPALLDSADGTVKVLGPPLLVRSLAAVDGALLVGHVDPTGTGPDEHGLSWSVSLLRPAEPGRLRPATVSAPDASRASAEPGPATGASPAWPSPGPDTVHPVATGFADARLMVPPGGSGPLLLWIRALRRGETPSPGVPHFLAAAGHRTAVLDLPLHWPDDATPDLLHGQITGAVATALEILDTRGSTVAVGGHSFGATLALYALAHLPSPAGGIAHSGCYNRTLTPTGFHYERRSLWTAPEIYRAFSALHFADRLDRPVLILHGAEDTNPATTPDQAVELYRGVVATGGTARLVLLPQEGHTFRSREALATVAGEHHAWLEKLEAN